VTKSGMLNTESDGKVIVLHLIITFWTCFHKDIKYLK
jgi:hypothetical protein